LLQTGLFLILNKEWKLSRALDLIEFFLISYEQSIEREREIYNKSFILSHMYLSCLTN